MRLEIECYYDLSTEEIDEISDMDPIDLLQWVQEIAFFGLIVTNVRIVG